MKIERFGPFGYIGTVEINDIGRIDYDVEQVFVRGQCHSFALALHQETDWPIVGFVAQAEDDGDTKDSPGHCAVYCPQLDEYIDVRGHGAKQRYETLFGPTEVVPIPANEVHTLKHYLPIRPDAAKPFVKTVLANLFTELLDIHGEAVLQRDWRQYGTDRQGDSGPFQS